MQDAEFEQQLLADRLRRAQAMRGEQGPQGRMVGNVFVAPNAMQYLAAGLRQYSGMRDEKDAQTALKDASSKRQEVNAKAMAEFLRRSQGTPENAPGDGMGPVMPAQAPDLRGAYGALSQAADPDMRKAGLQGILGLPGIEAAAAERKTDREFRSTEAAAARAEAAQARITQLELSHQQRMEMLTAQNASREQMAEAQRQFQREMAELRRGMSQGAQPYFQPLQTAQGAFAFNARTGKAEPVLGADGRQLVGSQSDPALQGSIKTAETAGKLSEEGKAAARGELRLISTFENLAGKAEAAFKKGPTASGIGAAADAAARVFGVTLPGAEAAAEIDALGAWMTGNVPRFEGPQSNSDREYYQLMAGQIGDRTRPIEERRAALRAVMAFMKDKRALEQARIDPAATPNPGGRRQRYDAQGNLIP